MGINSISFRLLLLLILGISFSLLSGCTSLHNDDPDESAIVSVSNLQNETFDGNLTIRLNNSTVLNQSLTIDASNVTQLIEIPAPENPPETYQVEVTAGNWTATDNTTESEGFNELFIVLEEPEDITVVSYEAG